MFNTVFLVLFSLALIISNIFFFIKKKYLYLFFPCLLFLPVYYGIEVSISLPVLSVTRIMYLILFVYSLINRKRNIDLVTLTKKGFSKEYLLLTTYFIFRIITNLRYVPVYPQATKTIFLLIFEQLFLLIAVYLLAPSKEEIINIIKIIVWVSTILFVIGILESILQVRPFDALYTIRRDIFNIPYYRLGLLRATTTMYAPALYGNMCVLIMPLILYLYETSRSKKYLIISSLDVLAVIHSGSRAAMFFLIIILIYYFIFILTGKNRRFKFIKNFSLVTALLLLYISLACFISPTLNYFYIGNAKAVLNEVGFEFDLTKGKPSNSNSFGGNTYGTASRTRQLTGIYYVAKLNPVFGMGADATSRGEIRYYWHFGKGNDKWTVGHVYDVGIVEIFCDEGILGLLGFISLFLYIYLKTPGSKFHRYFIFCYLLCTLGTKNMYAFLLLFLIMITNHNQRDS